MDLLWSTVSEAFGKLLKQAAARGGLVRDALTHSYPRLQLLVEGTLTRCVRDSDVPAVLSAVLPPHHEAVMRCLTPLQEAFMSGSFARLQEAVSALYPSGGRTLPAASAVQQCIGCDF